MIRFISAEEKDKPKQLWKKGVIKTLSAAMIISPMVALVPTAAQAAPLVGVVPTVGDGTSISPYIITTPEELYYMNTKQNGHYKLGANIDLSNYEWSPIGNFSGTLDGAGHYIKNLKITQYKLDIGLFGTVAAGGIVKNLGILHADFAIPSASGVLNNVQGKAGVIAGTNWGEIENCHVSGTIKVTGIQTYYTNSREDGGLVGYNAAGATIKNSLAQVDVGQTGYAFYENGRIGGLAGTNDGSISYSYFVGTVKDDVNQYYPRFDTSDPGGSVGGGSPGTVLATFWDSTVGGSINNNSGGTPKTTTEMKSQLTYAGWDFTNVWAIQEGVTYPFLRNYQPTVQEISDKMINIADGSYSIDLTSSFTDPAGEPLTITAVSSNPAVLTTQVSGNQLLLTPIAQGTVTVTATAINSQGAVVTDSFEVTVVTTGSVTGVVYGSGNSPISGASVSIGGISDVTDAQGEFTLTNIAPGSQTVTVSSAGYNNGSATVTVTAGQSVSAGTITLTEVATTGTVTGIVHGSGNSPISGASVSIGGISVITDVLGEFTLTNISPGSQTITVGSAGYNNGSATVTVTAGQNVSTGTITLTEVVTTGTVTGAVYGPGNSPICGASVSIGGISDVTDAEGEFTLTKIAPGSQTVTVSSTGYNNESATVTVTAGQSVSAGTITLTEVATTGTVTGAVYGPGNSPISGASVSIGGISDVTDAQGEFTLTNIVPGSQTVTVSSAGYNNGSATVTVTAGQNVSTGTITLTEVATTGTVTGIVHGSNNSPLSGASVSIGGISVITDALGEFTLTKIAPGSQTVTVSSTGYNNESATVTVTAGQNVSAGTITLTEVATTGTVTGIVYGPGNNPISGASVSIGGISVTTDVLGEFTLTNISPGSQTITVGSAGYNNGSATVTVTAGQNVSTGTITLTEVVTTGTVTGIVHGSGNSPISGASVSIGGISVTTDVLGEFTLTNISPGSQTVNVSSVGYNNGSATVTVTAGQSVSTGTISLTAVTGTTPTGPITPTTPTPATPTPTTPTTPEPSKPVDPTPAGANVFNSGIIDISKLISFLESKLEEANQSPISLQFSDTKGHWAEQAILAFVKLGAVQGNGTGEFIPNGNITRAEFATFMVRVFNIQSGTATHSSFTDITGHWGSDAILKLAQAGVIKGYADSTFHPDQFISREEMMLMLTRILNFDSVSKDSTKGEFTDLSNSFAAASIKEAAQAGIINGTGNGKFKPKSSTTRAEALTIIMNALSLDPQLKSLLDSLK
ncbi:hypothetical protein J2T13_001286 [Paenibacillus sp. DS2015]|uniref:carboxypeptidase regulatory-like domain-containing protein n=1 Tax=Paenibacillus sp. DS2015 TaxID=3373917 RepID=UPI003D2362ED